MTDTPENPVLDAEVTEPQVDELTLLKQRAKTLGISFHPAIGVDALKKKIEDHLSETPAPEAAVTAAADVADAAPVEMTPNQRRRAVRAEALKLVRIRVTNLNPLKKDLKGEFFTVANDIIGDVKKFVPYGEQTDDGFHVQNVIFREMKSRKFLQVKTRKDPAKPGHMIVDQRWVPELAIEVLPQLSREELDELARTQAAAGGV